MSLAASVREDILHILDDDIMRVLTSQRVHQVLAAPPFFLRGVERQILREAPLPDAPPNPLQEIHFWHEEKMVASRGLYLFLVYEGVFRKKIGIQESQRQRLLDQQLPLPAGVEEITLAAPACVLYGDFIARDDDAFSNEVPTTQHKTLVMSFDDDVNLRLSGNSKGGKSYSRSLQFRDTFLSQLAHIYAEALHLRASAEAEQTLLLALMHRLRYLLLATQPQLKPQEEGIAEPQLSKTRQKHQQLCLRAIEIAQTTPQLSPSVKDIARQLEVSEFFLSRIFHQEYGETLIHHLSVMRINIAQNLLRTTDEPIATVARQAGFSSGESFSHIFRKHTGMSPRQFRNQYKLQLTQ